MPTEISTINATSNTASQRQVSSASGPSPVVAAKRQVEVTSGQSLPSEQVQAVADPVSGAVQLAEINSAVSDINAFVQTINRELQFSLEEELPLGRAVIRVVDAETDEVIREIPSKEVLQIAERLSELNESLTGDSEIRGLIIQAQA